MNTKKLDKAFGTSQFHMLVSGLTANELNKYMDESTHDIVLWVWSNCVTWGFEAYWAGILGMSEQERTEQGVSLDELPENFDPNIQLKDVSLWAPQDQIIGRFLS